MHGCLMMADARDDFSTISTLRDALQCLIESDIYVRVLLNREDAVTHEALLELHLHLENAVEELKKSLSFASVSNQLSSQLSQAGQRDRGRSLDR